MTRGDRGCGCLQEGTRHPGVQLWREGGEGRGQGDLANPERMGREGGAVLWTWPAGYPGDLVMPPFMGGRPWAPAARWRQPALHGAGRATPPRLGALWCASDEPTCPLGEKRTLHIGAKEAGPTDALCENFPFSV